MAPAKPRNRIRIAISSCLLGQAVRYDAGHKHNGYITKTLGQYFDFVPFCPEVAIGLGVPRPPIRLVRGRGGIAARRIDEPSIDVTEKLAAYAHRAVSQLGGVSGYILKKGSPSCGMKGVKVYSSKGVPVASSAGIYAARLMELVPALPIEDELRLMDPARRDNFIERVFVYHRWQRASRRLTPKRLIDFHASHKLMLLAHDEKAYRALGRIVAHAGDDDVRKLGARYITEFMRVLQKPASRGRQANVLQHVIGFFKRQLDAADKRELVRLIDDFRRGRTPLGAPLTLIHHYLRRFPNAYLQAQHYLNPEPDESLLRKPL